MHNDAAESFSKLINIMSDLRTKCPWDKKQTIESLRAMTIEELYELVDAIDNKDWTGIKEELGDLMLHVAFYSEIAAEQNKFTIKDSLDAVCEKLILRHPHIYGDVQVENDEDVARNWQNIKKSKEGKKSILGGVPSSLPAVVKACRIQEKANQVGFDWKNIDDVWKKVEEEKDELKEAVQNGSQSHIEDEFGDLMFSLINYARFLNIDADSALEKANKKFISRFNLMEQSAEREGKILSDMTLEEMDQIWDKIKHIAS